jgi:excisionase family DNA binding protein
VIPKLLSPEEVARACGLSRRAVYDAIKRGELPAIRLCSRLRIRAEDLEAWFTRSAVEPAEVTRLPIPKPAPPPPPPGSFRAKLRASGGGEG